MESRPFRFALPATSRLPAQTYVCWVSVLWLLQEREGGTSLLAVAPEVETSVCQAMSARVRSFKLEWVGLQGRHHVEVISSGSYLMNEYAPGLWVGRIHDPSPGAWLGRMIAINRQDAVVGALKGTYLVGAPWESPSTLLASVRGEVDELRQSPQPDWGLIAHHCERFLLAGFIEHPEIQQYLYILWLQVPFQDPWSAVLKRHQIGV